MRMVMRSVIFHVLTDITFRRTNCATKLKTAKVTSINTKILVLLVMIYVQIAKKVMIQIQMTKAIKTERSGKERVMHHHFAIGVSLQQNLKLWPLAQRPNPNAFANLGRNPLQQLQKERLTQQEST